MEEKQYRLDRSAVTPMTFNEANECLLGNNCKHFIFDSEANCIVFGGREKKTMINKPVEVV